MSKKYSKEELIALLRIRSKYGRISYGNPPHIDEIFKEMTGVHRDSGPLYMASWRIDQGKYDHIIY